MVVVVAVAVAVAEFAALLLLFLLFPSLMDSDAATAARAVSAPSAIVSSMG